MIGAERNKGADQQGDAGKLPVKLQAEIEYPSELQHVGKEGDGRPDDGLFQGVHVIHKAAHDVAGLIIFKIPDREMLDVVIQLIPHVVDKPLPQFTGHKAVRQGNAAAGSVNKHKTCGEKNKGYQGDAILAKPTAVDVMGRGGQGF